MNHSFDPILAQELKSIELAIMIHDFQLWIAYNKRLGRNQHEGRTWTYNTIVEIAAHFPYWSRDQVMRLLQKAVKMKILRKGNFNKKDFDRTVWYAFEDEKRFQIGAIRQMHLAKSLNVSKPRGKNGQNPSPVHETFSEIATPIPYTIPYTYPSSSSSSLHSEESEEGSAQARNCTSTPSKSIKRKEHISTTEQEHQKLIEKFGLKATEAAYQRLSEWKMDTPRSKWKKCDYRSILRWVMDAIKEKKSKEEKSDYKPSALAFSTNYEDGYEELGIKVIRSGGKK